MQHLFGLKTVNKRYSAKWLQCEVVLKSRSQVYVCFQKCNLSENLHV